MSWTVDIASHEDPAYNLHVYWLRWSGASRGPKSKELKSFSRDNS